jgi:hypothetical protein
MNDEIKRVLKMVEEGKIKADEGAKLIEAIESSTVSSGWIDLNSEEAQPSGDPDQEPPVTGKKPSWLYIMVDGRCGVNRTKNNVRVRIPIKLARWGLKFVPRSAQAEMKKEFGEDFDFKQLGDIIDELPVGVDLINVYDDEKEETVRIFLR